MNSPIDHPGADWAGSAGGYVCLHCGARVTDAEWGARLQAAREAPAEVAAEPVAPQPEPKPKKAPAPRKPKKAAKKA